MKTRIGATLATLQYFPQGSVCLSLMGVKQTDVKEIEQMAKFLHLSLSSLPSLDHGERMWQLSMVETSSTEMTARFYYWDPHLLEIFNNASMSENEKLAAAEKYLKIENTRDRIWQDALLSCTQALITNGWLDNISLINPPSSEKNQVLGTFGDPTIAFGQRTPDKEVVKIINSRSVYTDFCQDALDLLYAADFDNLHEFSSSERLQIDACGRFLQDLSTSYPSIDLIMLLSKLIVKVMGSIWQQGEHGVEKKDSIYKKSNTNVAKLVDCVEILRILNIYKWFDCNAPVPIHRCDEVMYLQLQAALTPPDSRKIKVDAAAIEFQFELLEKTQLRFTFLFNDEKSAQTFYQQFWEKFVVKKMAKKWGNINYSVCKPTQQKGRFAVVCTHYSPGLKEKNLFLSAPRLQFPQKGPAPLFIHQDNEDTYLRLVCLSPEGHSLQALFSKDYHHEWATEHRVAFCREYWKFVLLPIANYFDIPGLKLVLQHAPYQVLPNGSLLQVRFDTADPTKMAIILANPTDNLKQQLNLLRVQKKAMNNSKRKHPLKLDIAIYSKDEENDAKVGEQVACDYLRAMIHPIKLPHSLAHLLPGITLDLALPLNCRTSSRLRAENVREKEKEIGGMPPTEYSVQGEWKQLGDIMIFSAPGFPLPPPKKMPHDRKYDEYEKLLEPQYSLENLKSNDHRRDYIAELQALQISEENEIGEKVEETQISILANGAGSGWVRLY